MDVTVTAFLPTTRVTVLRAEDEADSFGDVRPSTTAMSVASGVPAAITEGSQASYQPVEGRRGVVEAYTVRLRPGVDVAEDDRLLDERTGITYVVTAVSAPQSLVGVADVRCATYRTGAASQLVNS